VLRREREGVYEHPSSLPQHLGVPTPRIAMGRPRGVDLPPRRANSVPELPGHRGQASSRCLPRVEELGEGGWVEGLPPHHKGDFYGTPSRGSVPGTASLFGSTMGSRLHGGGSSFQDTWAGLNERDRLVHGAQFRDTNLTLQPPSTRRRSGRGSAYGATVPGLPMARLVGQGARGFTERSGTSGKGGFSLTKMSLGGV